METAGEPVVGVIAFEARAGVKPASTTTIMLRKLTTGIFLFIGFLSPFFLYYPVLTIKQSIFIYFAGTIFVFKRPYHAAIPHGNIKDRM